MRNSISNYDVFLQTLKTSAPAPTQPSFGVSPVQTTPVAADQLVPILSTLARYQVPISVSQLASEAQVQVTPLVLNVQNLVGAGVIEHDASSDSVKLTDLGRQILAVGKMMTP